jgi:hypothetical protein
MNLICPFCKFSIFEKGPCPKCIKTQFKQTRFSCPFFDFYTKNNELHFYQINIEVDGNLYGFDSYKEGPSTNIVACSSEGKWTLLTRLNYFTPVPKSKEEVETVIKRLFNLKAFL